MILRIDLSWSAWMTKEKEMKDVSMWIQKDGKKIMIDQDKINQCDLEDIEYFIYHELIDNEMYKNNKPQEFWFEDTEINIDYETTSFHGGCPAVYYGECASPEEPAECEFELYWGVFLLPEWVYEDKIESLYNEILRSEVNNRDNAKFEAMNEGNKW
jgi:hypothetical protein